MTSNVADSKKRRLSGSGDEVTPLDKRLRLSNPNQTETRALATSSQLVQSINAEWSRTMTTKRSRSKSNEPSSRNVRARLTVDLSSSNPEPTSFLMGVLATELENIGEMLSANTSKRSNGAMQSPPPTVSMPSSMTSSPQSSPDYFDKVVMHGKHILDKLHDDPELTKYYTFR